MAAGPPGHVERAAERLVGPSDALPRAALVAVDGTGRTETLDTVVAILGQRGVEVVRISCRRADHDVAYAALEELLPARTPPANAKGQRAARTFVAERASGSVLVVDDAHWLDDVSRRVLAALADESDALSLGIVVAARPVGPRGDDPLVGALARAGVVVEPETLTDVDIAERAARVLGRAVDAAVVEDLAARAAGHPRLVDALALGWRSPDAPDPLPSALADAVVAATSALSAGARETLVALALGTTPDDDVLAALVGTHPSTMPDLWAELRGAGVLVPGHDEPAPVVAEVVGARTDAATRRELHRRLADLLGARGAPAPLIAEHLVAAGVSGGESASVLVAAGEAQLSDAPEVARGLFDAAVDAGADPVALAGARAEAAALAGFEDEAVTIADGAIGGPPDSVARAAVVVAGVLARRGLWARAARTYRAASGHPALPDDAVHALGFVASVAIGHEPATPADDGAAPTTIGADVARLLGETAIATGAGDVAAARRAAGEAADLLETAASTVVLPETPHALGALVALACGDSDDAERLAGRALDAGIGGPSAAMRHRLLLGLAQLRAGRWDRVQSTLDVAHGPGTTRDALLRAALAVGLARRLGDVGRLSSAWEAALPVVAAVRGDLYLTLPLCELVVAAARLGQRDAVRDRELELDGVLSGLGGPGLWARPLAWARVEAAVTSGDAHDLVTRTAELRSAPPAHPRLAGLDAAAAAWTGLIAGGGDGNALEVGVAGLEQAGLVWEASRLVGQAAIRADDPGDTRSLLGRARELHGTLPVLDDAGVPTGTVLSAREREVAACVVDGLTHKEIGAMLFISPKTVEHHVARIRQKLGASTRAEMLAGLRATLAAADEA